MKIAFISDIHGNIDALNAIVEELEKTEIYGIAFLGDYITDFPYHNEVLTKMQELSRKYRTWIVKGNREDYIIDHYNGKYRNWTFSNTSATLLYTFESLLIQHLGYISNMPNELVINLRGYKPIYIRHRVKREEWPKHPYVVSGHFHYDFEAEKPGTKKYILNSAGLAYNGTPGAHYAIATSIGEEWIITRHVVDYDRKALIRKVRKHKVYRYPSKWMMMVCKTLETGNGYLSAYWTTALQRCVERGIGSMDMQLEDIPNSIWREVRTELLENKDTKK